MNDALIIGNITHALLNHGFSVEWQHKHGERLLFIKKNFHQFHTDNTRTRVVFDYWFSMPESRLERLTNDECFFSDFIDDAKQRCRDFVAKTEGLKGVRLSE